MSLYLKFYHSKALTPNDLLISTSALFLPVTLAGRTCTGGHHQIQVCHVDLWVRENSQVANNIT